MSSSDLQFLALVVTEVSDPVVMAALVGSFSIGNIIDRAISFEATVVFIDVLRDVVEPESVDLA